MSEQIMALMPTSRLPGVTKPSGSEPSGQDARAPGATTHTPGQTPVKSPDPKKAKLTEKTVLDGDTYVEQVGSEAPNRMDSQATLPFGSPLAPTNLVDKFEAATEATTTPRAAASVMDVSSPNLLTAVYLGLYIKMTFLKRCRISCVH